MPEFTIGISKPGLRKLVEGVSIPPSYLDHA